MGSYTASEESPAVRVYEELYALYEMIPKSFQFEKPLTPGSTPLCIFFANCVLISAVYTVRISLKHLADYTAGCCSAAGSANSKL